MIIDYKYRKILRDNFPPAEKLPREDKIILTAIQIKRYLSLTVKQAVSASQSFAPAVRLGPILHNLPFTIAPEPVGMHLIPLPYVQVIEIPTQLLIPQTDLKMLIELHRVLQDFLWGSVVTYLFENRDNDYDSFRNEILHKVDNNLELILSNVDEMDLSRPISREEQRRNNLKKSVPEIEIVKVENYFEILDQLKN